MFRLESQDNEKHHYRVSSNSLDRIDIESGSFSSVVVILLRQV